MSSTMEQTIHANDATRTTRREPTSGAVRALADGLGLVVALPFYVWYLFESAVFGGATAFEGTTQAVGLLPGKIGMFVRRAFLRLTLRHCSPTCAIGFGTLFSDRRASIGEWVYIGPNCDLGWVSIENDVLLGSAVHVLSGKGQHGIEDIDRPIRLQGGDFHEVRIGASSWIGNGAIVLANIGRGCVVGAGSVVVQDVEDYSIVAGNPARLIRKRT